MNNSVHQGWIIFILQLKSFYPPTSLIYTSPWTVLSTIVDSLICKRVWFFPPQWIVSTIVDSLNFTIDDSSFVHYNLLMPGVNFKKVFPTTTRNIFLIVLKNRTLNLFHTLWHKSTNPSQWNAILYQMFQCHILGCLQHLLF